MTPADLDRLEALAAAATPGPWVAQSRDDGRSKPWYIDTHANPDGPEPVWAPPQHPVSQVDAAYIAALSPDVVRSLVADARLGAAWREAEAALPEGWCVIRAYHYDDGNGSEHTPERYGAPALDPVSGGHLYGNGPTPAAALLSLAEALRGRS